MKVLAKQCGYSLKKLADEVGINYSSILRYNDGSMSPTLDVVIKISLCLDKSLKTIASSLGYDVDNVPDDTMYQIIPSRQNFQELPKKPPISNQ